MPEYLSVFSGGLLILILFALVVLSLIILVPQLLRAQQRRLEMDHAERMLALEKGQQMPPVDEASRMAGRTTLLVPMVVIISAGTVTCFLVAHRPTDEMFAVTLTVWAVAGMVSLAAITGGVALLGRLAQLHSDEEEEPPSNPLEG